MQYRGRPTNLREIGKALGVSNILEGSVRRSGNQVRVNVQLIDANTDEHVWANDYDRRCDRRFCDSKRSRSKIAECAAGKTVADRESADERKPTENGEAYLAFVQAHDLSCAMEDLTKLKQSEQLYQRAIELDPNFALAARALFAIGKLDAAHTRRLTGTPRKSAQLWQSGLCNYSLICPRLIWRWGSRITMATTITTRR